MEENSILFEKQSSIKLKDFKHFFIETKKIHKKIELWELYHINKVISESAADKAWENLFNSCDLLFNVFAKILLTDDELELNNRHSLWFSEFWVSAWDYFNKNTPSWHEWLTSSYPKNKVKSFLFNMQKTWNVPDQFNWSIPMEIKWKLENMLNTNHELLRVKYKMNSFYCTNN